MPITILLETKVTCLHVLSSPTYNPKLKDVHFTIMLRQAPGRIKYLTFLFEKSTCND